MAESPAHRFGQIIGKLLESIVHPQLNEFCSEQGLYLDHQLRIRPARRGRKVSWTDQYGNLHDLDFVIERDGTDQQIGRPLAFIESAWRRYPKHSRNKAQEIQGAILPLADKYRWNNPFLGTVLAGVFTRGSLDQLRSLGFQVLYFPYDMIVKAFQLEGIDIAFDEHTPDSVFGQTAEQIEASPPDVMIRVRQHLIDANQVAVDEFFGTLRQRLSRYVTRVVITPLYGRVNEFTTIEDTVSFLEQHRIYEGQANFEDMIYALTSRMPTKLRLPSKPKTRWRSFWPLSRGSKMTN